MGYTEEELLEFIERHDEHEDYYRGQLDELRGGAMPDDLAEIQTYDGTVIQA